MGPCWDHWIRAGNGLEWAGTLFLSMFHVVTCIPHAAEENPDFPLHVSSLGIE